MLAIKEKNVQLNDNIENSCNNSLSITSEESKNNSQDSFKKY